MYFKSLEINKIFSNTKIYQKFIFTEINLLKYINISKMDLQKLQTQNFTDFQADFVHVLWGISRN